MEKADAKNLVRCSVASIVCASAAVVTSALVASRRERSPAVAAMNGGFASAAAIFAFASASEALRLRPAATSLPQAELRASLAQISRLAQAGTIGDADAARYAFAMIARAIGECEVLLERA